MQEVHLPQEFVEEHPQSQDLSDYVTIRIARTRGTDTAGVGRGTSVVTGNRRRTAIRVGFTGRALRTTVVRRTAIGAGLVGNVTVGIGLAGGTPVTGVVSGTAIGTAHGRNRTFGTNGTAVVVTAAGSSPIGWYSPEQLEELYLNSDLQTQSLYFPSQEPPETV